MYFHITIISIIYIVFRRRADSKSNTVIIDTYINIYILTFTYYIISIY